MPEMPEVQAHGERMSEALRGATLTQFRLINFAGLKTFSPAPDAAVGSKLIEVSRRAKYLLLRFDNGHTHVVHLMQGGRLRPDPKQARKPRNGILRWVFEVEGGFDTYTEAWLLTEAGHERKAGVWVVDESADGGLDGQEPLSRLAPEADGLTKQELAIILGANSKRLHGLLRSQSIVSGLGRMLANEICFVARLSPFVNASKLEAEQIDRLHDAIAACIADGIAHERTLDDIGKSADRPSKTHNRAGEACVGIDCGGTDVGACEDTIATVEYRNYTVYYCPTRQTSGKLLADNTTSKFLK